MSKEFPKEMLPIYLKDDDYIVLKPLLQAVFEQLYRYGIRDFCFIVGRGKRAIEDHFTPDSDYIRRMESKVKGELLTGMLNFYKMIENSTIVWINQPEPKGFGHAILMARPFVSGEQFVACAGDTFILSDRNNFLNKMINAHFRYDADSTILVHRVSDPRQYGVAIVEKIEDYTFRVTRVLEKPQKPPTEIA
ncbi:MAG: sugar phosphate nucleotidyltransferase, partial [Nitrososphaerota archaeon]